MKRAHKEAAAALAAALLLAGAAGAQQKASAPAAQPQKAQPRPAPQPEQQVRVRASHRVDVIAPGEHVETIIDRMRARGAAPAGDARAADHPPLRGPDGQRGPDRGPLNKQHGPPGARGPGAAGPPPERPR
jgi:hypothetical protein